MQGKICSDRSEEILRRSLGKTAAWGALTLALLAGCSSSEIADTRRGISGSDSTGDSGKNVVIPVDLAEADAAEGSLNLADLAKVSYRPHFVARYEVSAVGAGGVASVPKEALADLGYNQETNQLLPLPANELVAKEGNILKIKKVYVMGLRPQGKDSTPWKNKDCKPMDADTGCVVLQAQGLTQEVSVPAMEGQIKYKVEMVADVFKDQPIKSNGARMVMRFKVSQSLDATDVNGIIIGGGASQSPLYVGTGLAAPEILKQPRRNLAQRIMKGGNNLVVVELDLHCIEDKCPTQVEGIQLGKGTMFAAATKVALTAKTVAAKSCSKDALDGDNQFCFHLEDHPSAANEKLRIVRIAMSGFQVGAENSFEVKLLRDDATDAGRGSSTYTWNQVTINLPATP